MGTRRRPASKRSFALGARVKSQVGCIGTVQRRDRTADGRVHYRVRWDSGFESFVRPVSLELFHVER